jgi:hypothetical protein
MGGYRMGFDVTPDPAGSRLRVFIDYATREGWIARGLGTWYARWCVEHMVQDAVRHFAPAPAVDADQPRPRRP